MKVSNSVVYIWLLTWSCRHGQPVQGLRRGQEVYPLPQALDEVAGTKDWTKLKFEQNFECINIGLIYDETVL